MHLGDFSLELYIYIFQSLGFIGYLSLLISPYFCCIRILIDSKFQTVFELSHLYPAVQCAQRRSLQ